MRAHHLPVTRTARFFTLGPADDPPRECWIAFHGYGFLAERFARGFKPIDDGARLIVVPEGLSRFYVRGTAGKIGASWMTSEDREAEIRDQVAYLDALVGHLGLAASATHLLGFSQGAATACRWVALGKVVPTRLVVWGGSIPPDLDWDRDGERFRHLEEVVLVTGTRDRYTPPGLLDRHAALLEAHGVSHRTIVFQGGHRLDTGTLRALATDGGPPTFP